MDVLQHTLSFLPYEDISSYDLTDSMYEDLIGRDFTPLLNSRNNRSRYEGLVQLSYWNQAKMYTLLIPMRIEESRNRRVLVTEEALKRIMQGEFTRGNWSNSVYTEFYSILPTEEDGRRLKEYLLGNISLEGKSRIYSKEKCYTFNFNVDNLVLVCHGLCNIIECGESIPADDLFKHIDLEQNLDTIQRLGELIKLRDEFDRTIIPK